MHCYTLIVCVCDNHNFSYSSKQNISGKMKQGLTHRNFNEASLHQISSRCIYVVNRFVKMQKEKMITDKLQVHQTLHKAELMWEIHLTVGNSVEHFVDLSRLIDFLFLAGQRMRGGQSIYSKCFLHIIQNDVVFLYPSGEENQDRRPEPKISDNLRIF